MQADVECDVLVVGAGITGALVAHRLTREGFRCVVLDKRDVGWGSTMASTALLQYELDVPLRELADQIGLDDALLAYESCCAAVERLESITAGLADRCGFRRCRSLFLARSPWETDELQRECALRRRAGVEAHQLSRRELQDRFNISRPSAILSAVAGVVEPFRFTHQLLAEASKGGARVCDRTGVVSFARDAAGGRFKVRTDRHASVTAERLVLATGYEACEHLDEPGIELRTTFALATEPIDYLQAPTWLHDCVVWESGDPYFYARAGPDGRLLMGGEDIAYASERGNQEALAASTERIAGNFARIVPSVPVEVAYAWSGVFARTRDGLGFFGEGPTLHAVDYALGFGGNGMVLAVLMADMLAAKYRGREHPCARLFRFGRNG